MPIDTVSQAPAFAWQPDNNEQVASDGQAVQQTPTITPPDGNERTIAWNYHTTAEGDVSQTPDSTQTTAGKDLEKEREASGTVKQLDQSSNLPFDQNYYKKYVEASGIPIVASAEVGDKALLKMRDVVDTMLKKDPATREALAKNLKGILIIPKDKGMTTLPEYANLDKTNPLPGQSWNDRAQGIGWTPSLPYVSASEANLLHSGSPQDRYPDESIYIHEFAHAVFDAGIASRDPGARSRLNNLFADAKANGYLQNSYAASNPSEYWAEGVQAWFNAAAGNGSSTTIGTNKQLHDADPKLWNELHRWFPAPDELTHAI
jgi:hypothetical protein